jgi:His-Xaa-Ser system protein HxsD
MADPSVGRDHSKAVVRVETALVSIDALMKTCYWFSRDFSCGIERDGEDAARVVLSAKDHVSEDQIASVQREFLAQAMDFALRERIDARTSEIRDLLLAKAFSEAGVLEEKPSGKFGDAIEEMKPDGMFKILSNAQR